MTTCYHHGCESGKSNKYPNLGMKLHLVKVVLCVQKLTGDGLLLQPLGGTKRSPLDSQLSESCDDSFFDKRRFFRGRPFKFGAAKHFNSCIILYSRNQYVSNDSITPTNSKNWLQHGPYLLAI